MANGEKPIYSWKSKLTRAYIRYAEWRLRDILNDNPDRLSLWEKLVGTFQYGGYRYNGEPLPNKEDEEDQVEIDIEYFAQKYHYRRIKEKIKREEAVSNTLNLLAELTDDEDDEEINNQKKFKAADERPYYNHSRM